MFVSHLRHHELELCEVDLAVSIGVNLCDDCSPDTLFFVDVVAKDGCDFVSLDGATTVFIEEFEGSLHVLSINELVLINGGDTPLAKVDGGASIGIGQIKYFVGAMDDLFVVFSARIELSIGVDELVLGDDAITVSIKLVEAGSEFFVLLLGGQMTRHKSQRCLLQLRFVLETRETGDSLFDKLLVELSLHLSLDPGVIKSLNGS